MIDKEHGIAAMPIDTLAQYKVWLTSCTQAGYELAPPPMPVCWHCGSTMRQTGIFIRTPLRPNGTSQSRPTTIGRVPTLRPLQPGG